MSWTFLLASRSVVHSIVCPEASLHALFPLGSLCSIFWLSPATGSPQKETGHENHVSSRLPWILDQSLQQLCPTVLQLHKYTLPPHPYPIPSLFHPLGPGFSLLLMSGCLQIPLILSSLLERFLHGSHPSQLQFLLNFNLFSQLEQVMGLLCQVPQL
jgi:hypothetical protein